jgi:hypothetical protein
VPGDTLPINLFAHKRCNPTLEEVEVVKILPTLNRNCEIEKVRSKRVVT